MTNDKCAEQLKALEIAQKERDDAQLEVQRIQGEHNALDIPYTPEQEKEYREALAEEERLAEILRGKRKELAECEGKQ